MQSQKLRRRDFLKSVGLAAPVVLGSPSALAMNKAPAQNRLHLIKPERLRSGDVIGIVAPGSPPPDPADIDRYAFAIQKLGFQPKLAPNVRQRLGYLAGDDASRASDLMGMFADDSVKAIICVRGGYGSARLLGMLDLGFIRRHPKIFIGFSDITALHCALQMRSRLVTFHGPTLNTDITDSSPSAFSIQSLLKTVMQPSAPGSICGDAQKNISILKSGTATGPLVGGNLSVLSTLIGTPFQPRFKDAIFFFEDVSEPPYHFDARLTQLLNAGLLQQVAGVAVGTNKDCVDPDAAKSKEYQQSLDDVLRDRLLPLGVPVVSGLPFGHVRDNATLPMGLQATLDGVNGDLVMNESAVM
ncbi:MAG TPA: LD-carboxypeptidase [Candidatus Acidoferrales bacterium]|nr:LD-carboxypeptidase [Candidatus Acidoferrales bacterium]